MIRRKAQTTISALCVVSWILAVPAYAFPAGQGTTQPEMFTVGPGQGTFLVISDIHFDPFADPDIVPELISKDLDQWKSIFDFSAVHSFSQYGSDTNYPLFKSVLKAAQEYETKNHYDYVLVTGDYLAHDFREKYQRNDGKDETYEGFVIKTMIFVSRMIQQSFPRLPIFGALGNNDSVCGDYRLSPGDSFLANVSHEWKTLVLDPDAKTDFAIGGFYAVPHPTVREHELIVLNTTLWSPSYRDACSSTPTDPGAAELDWLAWKLYQLQIQKKNASLIMHIPPGVDAFASARLGKGDQPVNLWNPTYTSTFRKILEAYKPLLRDAYAGHLHMDDFRVLQDVKGAAFLEMHLVPAISPIYKNNPGFEVGLYNKRDGALTNYAIVFLRNLGDFQKSDEERPRWSTEYSVDTSYHVHDYGPESARKIAELIRSSGETRALYMKLYNVSGPASSSVTDTNWQGYACAQTEMTADGFTNCASSLHTVPQ